MEFNFELDGVNETTTALDRIRGLKRLAAQMTKVMLRIQKDLKQYPPQFKGLHVTFKTDKQRRYFFAALHEGKITVPYRRTKTLGRRWTTKVEFIAGGVEGIIGNVTPYGPYVQSLAKQAEIHQERWLTVEEELDNMQGDIVETLALAFATED